MSTYRVTILGSKTAERHERMVVGLTDRPEVRLGWKPYTVRVTTYGATPHTAFHSVRALKRWLAGRRLKLRRSQRGAARYSVASGWVEDLP